MDMFFLSPSALEPLALTLASVKALGLTSRCTILWRKMLAIRLWLHRFPIFEPFVSEPYAWVRYNVFYPMAVIMWYFAIRQNDRFLILGFPRTLHFWVSRVGALGLSKKHDLPEPWAWYHHGPFENETWCSPFIFYRHLIFEPLRVGAIGPELIMISYIQWQWSCGMCNNTESSPLYFMTPSTSFLWIYRVGTLGLSEARVLTYHGSEHMVLLDKT